MEEKVLDISEYFYAVKKSILFIIIVTIITTSLGVLNASKIVPTYQSSAKIFLGTKDNLMNLYSEDEIQYYGDFMDTFVEIIGVDDFINETLKKYNLNISAAQVRGGFQISKSSKTPIFTLVYSSSDSEIAKTVLSAICDELSTQVTKLIPGKEVEIIDSVKVWTVMPSKAKRVIWGFGIGLMSSLIIIFIKYYMDNTIKSRDHLAKLLPIPVLGEIPTHEREFVKEEKKYANSKGNAKLHISRSISNVKN
ncbi:Wzz/FepE/Etk N-terminal domain-containing protein [Clostridium sp.]|uniref:YveK family protein n=1 Tax=Clostridium sp. TaxID=1506 RepID=UPI0032162A1B